MIWGIIVVLVTSIFSEPIIIPIHKSTKNTYYIKTCLGQPIQCFELTLSSEETDLLLYSDCPYSSGKSSTYNLLSNDTHLAECTDHLSLSDTLDMSNIFEDVHFIRHRTTRRHRMGHFGLGLGRNATDKTKLLNKLLTNAKRKVFFFDAPKMQLGIRDYPPEYFSQGRNENTLRKKCKLTLDHEPQDNKYYCRLNSIIFTDNNDNNTVFYPINTDVSFSIETNTIVVPQEFFKLIIHQYLKKPLDNNDCKLNDKSGEFIYIQCKGDFDESTLDYLTVVIGNWSYRITPQDLFYQIKEDKIFLMLLKTKKNNWVFGYTFLKNYITVIDYETMEMTFIKPLIK